ncbi:hypothetical protein B9G55_20025 [Saccharibacillus sp. O16]|nr:hypothetical protein B9G55_20025 [Saccharibacillus sp. O16]
MGAFEPSLSGHRNGKYMAIDRTLFSGKRFGVRHWFRPGKVRAGAASTRLYEEDRLAYENLLLAASETCEAPQYRDATEHLHLVVRRSSSK